MSSLQETELLRCFRTMQAPKREHLLSVARDLSAGQAEHPQGTPAAELLALVGLMQFEEGEAERVWSMVEEVRESDYPCPPATS